MYFTMKNYLKNNRNYTSNNLSQQEKKKKDIIAWDMFGIKYIVWKNAKPSKLRESNINALSPKRMQ